MIIPPLAPFTLSSWIFSFVLAGWWNGVKPIYGIWEGECPHCEREIVQTAGEAGSVAFSCPICTQRLFIENGRFVAV
jgi:hypothetical protein